MVETALHRYYSTACQHGIHVECRRSCKWCEAPCQCACHGAEPDVLPGETDGLTG